MSVSMTQYSILMYMNIEISCDVGNLVIYVDDQLCNLELE